MEYLYICYRSVMLQFSLSLEVCQHRSLRNPCEINLKKALSRGCQSQCGQLTPNVELDLGSLCDNVIRTILTSWERLTCHRLLQRAYPPGHSRVFPRRHRSVWSRSKKSLRTGWFYVPDEDARFLHHPDEASSGANVQANQRLSEQQTKLGRNQAGTLVPSISLDS